MALKYKQSRRSKLKYRRRNPRSSTSKPLSAGLEYVVTVRVLIGSTQGYYWSEIKLPTAPSKLTRRQLALVAQRVISKSKFS